MATASYAALARAAEALWAKEGTPTHVGPSDPTHTTGVVFAPVTQAPTGKARP